MDNKQIAFIMCVNQNQECEEAVHYIEKLNLPKGYTRDVIIVTEATSMAAGYQVAMKSSDAKYKVYMHQDVFIYNKNFIENTISVFDSDKNIGAIGMIGRRKLPEEFYVAADWDVGNIYFNGAVSQIRKQEYSEWPMDADIVDGLLIATQYDIDWREDLFDGWDFYDISQCMEMKRAGYRVVVPYQQAPWCYHDNYYSKLKKYFVYQEIFCEEYQDIAKYKMLSKANSYNEMDELADQMIVQLKNVVNECNHQQLWDIIVQMNGRIHMAFRDFYILAQIDHLENTNLLEGRFWNDESWEQLSYKIINLKFKIKRMEFGMETLEKCMAEISKEYSLFAVAVIALQYASDKKYCIEKIGEWYSIYQGKRVGSIWDRLTEEHYYNVR